jgi:integrase
MRRDAKGPRLWLRPERRNKRGSVTHAEAWIIRDGSRQILTGCGVADRAEAERQLAQYIGDKYQPPEGRGTLESITVADVVGYYLSEKGIEHSRPKELAAHMSNILREMGTLPLAAVTGKRCREYVRKRKAPVSATRELEYLRAAVRFARTERMVEGDIILDIPSKSQPRDRWLTRSEAARLLWAAWRYKEKQRGKETRRYTRRHIARFVLVGLYTGSRAGVICAAGFSPSAHGRGYVDLGAGVFYRHAPGHRQSRKRAPPVPLSDRLLAHLRRWRDREICRDAVVEWHGRGVARVSKGFRALCNEIGMHDVHPHILRHTAATWLMQQGADMWQAAGLLGMTVQTLQEVYGHHHPGMQREAAQLLSGRSRLPQLPTG